MEKKRKMIFFSLVLVLISEVVRGGFVLDAAKCEQLMAIPPPDPLLEKEHCSVCEQIVHNSRSWNWAQHYESLCVNIPPHAMSWVCFFSLFFQLFTHTHTTTSTVYALRLQTHSMRVLYVVVVPGYKVEGRGRFRIHGSVSCKVFMFILS